MLDEFLKNTCTITRETEINDNWEVSKSITTIYSNIYCQIYEVTSGLDLTNLAENTPNNKWKIILEANKINVKLWDIIAISDKRFWNIWKYQIIKPPKMNEFTSWDDSIQLECKSI